METSKADDTVIHLEKFFQVRPLNPDEANQVFDPLTGRIDQPGWFHQSLRKIGPSQTVKNAIKKVSN